MGAFAIIRRKKNARRDREEAKIISSLQSQGFQNPVTIETTVGLVLISPKMVAGKVNLVQNPNGDFAFYTGTMIYKNLTGTAALDAVLALPEKTLPAAEDLSGCFALLVSKDEMALVLDPLSSYRVYINEDEKIWSSSFLAVAATIAKPKINIQEIYEYVFDGATYGTKSVLSQVSMLAPNTIVSFSGSGTRKKIIPTPTVSGSIEQTEMVSYHSDLLRDLFGRITQAFNGKIDMALTAGYDSRLMLALCMDAGISPRLHVYGAASDTDVQIAQAIAKGEGLNIHHVDKNKSQLPDPDSFADSVRNQFYAFDACPPDGVIGDGADLATRRDRCAEDFLSLNGGCGEIYRNFFYLPDRSFKIQDVIRAFWSQFDPTSCTAFFNENHYISTLSAKALDACQFPAERLSRKQVEYLYPGFRGRFWTARNTCVNLRFGEASTPFLDMALVRSALEIPLGLKYCGAFEASLIEAVNSRLATYLSDYGHRFNEPPNFKHKFSEWTTRIRPPWLRRMSFRLRSRYGKMQLPNVLTPEFSTRFLPRKIEYMSHFFHLDKIRDAGQMNRILTLEYLFQTVDADMALPSNR